MSSTFGNFASLSAFLESYRAAEKVEYMQELEDLPVREKAKHLQKTRDVVEVMASLRKREPDDTDVEGGTHYRLRIEVSEVVMNDPDVAEDVQAAINQKLDIFCAIRYGDAMGIQTAIEGLSEGSNLHLRGEWITKEKAKAHGGEKMSVLHFTHHPVGFICTAIDCYS